LSWSGARDAGSGFQGARMDDIGIERN